MNSPYDAFAWFYDRYWADSFQDWQEPAIEQLLLRGIEPGAHILDLCCGTGQLCSRLAARGFAVTGVDSSQEMLNAARHKLPASQFIHADAAAFDAPSQFDAAVCTFDSVNHWIAPGQMECALRRVHEALKPHGHLVFDINTDAAYGERWDQSASHEEPDHAFLIRGHFCSEARIGTTQITLRRLVDGEWQRWDVEMKQKPCVPSQMTAILERAGFDAVQSFRATEDLGMNGHFGLGRVYFRACRKS